MKPISRRTFAGNVALLAGAGLLPVQSGCRRKAASSLIEGVQIGVQSYSFRDRSFEEAIDAMVEVGIDSCELWQGHIEPRGLEPAELRRWRLKTPLGFFEDKGSKLEQAGIRLNSYNYSFQKTMSPEEVDRGFLMARALGTDVITASASPSLAPLIDSFARKHRIRVGMHNHAHGDKEDVFDGPQDFAAAMEGNSPYICVNLDIGHFVAAGFDPVDYIARHHQRIVALHLKDRKKGMGPRSPVVKFGTGDTPIREVLQQLKAGKYPIPANIEHEIKGQPAMEGVRESLEYCRQALA